MDWGDPQQAAPGFLLHLSGIPPKPRRPVKRPDTPPDTESEEADLNTGPHSHTVAIKTSARQKSSKQKLRNRGSADDKQSLISSSAESTRSSGTGAHGASSSQERHSVVSLTAEQNQQAPATNGPQVHGEQGINKNIVRSTGKHKQGKLKQQTDESHHHFGANRLENVQEFAEQQFDQFKSQVSNQIGGIKNYTSDANQQYHQPYGKQQHQIYVQTPHKLVPQSEPNVITNGQLAQHSQQCMLQPSAPPYGQQILQYGQQVPQYGQHAPLYGQQVLQYGQPAPLYGQQVPQYGQQVPQYGQQIKQYSQQIPQYGQQVSQYDQQISQYGQHTPQYGQQVRQDGQRVVYQHNKVHFMPDQQIQNSHQYDQHAHSQYSHNIAQKSSEQMNVYGKTKNTIVTQEQLNKPSNSGLPVISPKGVVKTLIQSNYHTPSPQTYASNVAQAPVGLGQLFKSANDQTVEYSKDTKFNNSDAFDKDGGNNTVKNNLWSTTKPVHNHYGNTRYSDAFQRFSFTHLGSEGAALHDAEVHKKTMFKKERRESRKHQHEKEMKHKSNSFKSKTKKRHSQEQSNHKSKSKSKSKSRNDSPSKSKDRYQNKANSKSKSKSPNKSKDGQQSTAWGNAKMTELTNNYRRQFSSKSPGKLQSSSKAKRDSQGKSLSHSPTKPKNQSPNKPQTGTQSKLQSELPGRPQSNSPAKLQNKSSARSQSKSSNKAQSRSQSKSPNKLYHGLQSKPQSIPRSRSQSKLPSKAQSGAKSKLQKQPIRAGGGATKIQIPPLNHRSKKPMKAKPRQMPNSSKGGGFGQRGRGFGRSGGRGRRGVQR